MIQSINLDSSHLESAAYDDTNQSLDVTFKNGRTYRYSNVEPVVASNLASAKSPGSFFYSQIKNSYDFEEISG